MARYIEANDLVRTMTLQANRTATGEICPPDLSYNEMLEIIADAPTADVVPSSEIAKEFTCFVGDPQKVDHCPYLDEIEKAKIKVEKIEQAYNSRLAKDIETNADFVKYAKAEVAREIFEEIERLLDNYSTAQCYQGEVFVQKSFDYELENAIAELKKKYTEGNDANS